MEAKDGSMSFDFEGGFTAIAPLNYIRYKLENNREVDVQFGQTIITETFEAEDENSVEQQRQAWLMILANFKQYVGRVQRPKMSIGEYGFITLAIDTEGNMFGLHSSK